MANEHENVPFVEFTRTAILRERAPIVPVSEAAGFVLAGGKSSRMGTDKALVPFAGQSLIENALAILRKTGVVAAISGSHPDLSAYGEQVPDTFGDAGPLGGIHAALSSPLAMEWNVFLPVDMPLVPPMLLGHMIAAGKSSYCPVVCSSLESRLQPFPVVLNKAVLPHIERLLSGGKRACFHAWRTIPQTLNSSSHVVRIEDFVGHPCCKPQVDFVRSNWFESANTPEDLARLNRLVTENADNHVRALK